MVLYMVFWVWYYNGCAYGIIHGVLCMVLQWLWVWYYNGCDYGIIMDVSMVL